MTTKIKDIAERALWTAVEAGVAYGSTHLTGIPVAYAVPIATALAALKGWIATKITGTGTAALGNGL